jgi:hypothetical protein
MNISIFHSKKRRDSLRFVQFCPTTFDHDGRSYTALMTELSEQGAQFTANTSSNNLMLHPGDEIDFTIKTPYGATQSRGEVCWSRYNHEHCTWGVSFTYIPSGSSSPLRYLINSAL